ncbi:MAG: hypothetical protein Q7P63_06455 [Verrucomicrobiota bacterium JB022]|nr:hypothetical protein [Verrucomicrobiota bacterium JB022]
MSERPPEAYQREVAQILQRLGAEPAASEVMAAQLLKRASQQATEEGIPPAQALQELLGKVIRARQGLPPVDNDFSPKSSK